MTLLDRIRADVDLVNYISDSCEENGFGVTLDPALSRQELLILKVDRYYNKQVPSPPRSPDCLVVQHCGNNNYRIFLIELKNAQLDTIKIREVREKFENCLLDFMSNRFRIYFYDLSYNIVSIFLFFVTDPLDQRTKIRSKNAQPTKLDSLLSLPPCVFANKRYLINHVLPDPMIGAC